MARQYGVSATQLRQWRQRGIGPEYFQFTARTISYSDDYLRDWFNDPKNAGLLAGNLSGSAGTSRAEGRVSHQSTSPNR
ncbi:hypothetical protein [Arthrobacter globiformis]|uniref:hypothetical protein n=1 Tax=Arthrobacter globiformis TaxID=1665 RepID=UPI0027859DCD|nr:hypothetical protein [Arthrobacter globiformis]MDQ0867458.1 hypothetical protein [Arthrobacter globiformis]